MIRVSGPETQKALQLLTKSQPVDVNEEETVNKIKNAIKPRYATLRRLYYPNTNELIDKGLVLWFPHPHSFTGEDCCEFQVHGGVAVVTAICNALNSINGLRPALAGEFTRRAFRSNKLDLSEVEGIADLIHAETEIQRKQALIQANGILSHVYNDWRQRLLRAVACLEAYIDFAEDENIEPETMNNVQNDVDQLVDDLIRYLKDSRKGEMRRNGVKTVILGEPNVGKSSFMNYICQKPISIISSIEGTTRDVVECSFNIAGFPVVIADTAGLRHHTSDPIEQEGIIRARNYASDADLIILLVEANEFLKSNLSLKEFVREHLIKIGIAHEENISQKEMIVIANKSDLIDKIIENRIPNVDIAFVSCTQNNGIEFALQKIEKSLQKLTDCDETTMTLNAPNDRHRQFLSKCLDHLNDFKTFTHNDDFDYSIAALHLREAMHQLENISGRTVDNEKIYDFIFKQFCIGK